MDYCKTCVYYPPSSCDGKPCTQCDPERLFHNCYVNKEDYITKERMDERLAMMHRLYTESEEKHIFAPSEPITNADRIRSMTDEELAKYLAWLEDPQACYEWELYGNTEIISDWLEWLKQESES